MRRLFAFGYRTRLPLKSVVHVERRRRADRRWTRGRLAIYLTLTCGILAGCGSSRAATASNALRIPFISANGALAQGILSPSRFSATTPMFAAEMMHAGLMKFDPDLHVIPDLAVSIPTISSGGRTYTFTIRQDARFSNGLHCTAADVAKSWARTLSDPRRSPLVWEDLGGIHGAAAVSRGTSQTLSGVRIVDRLTLRIHLDRPDATFLDKLAFPVAAVDLQIDGRTLGLGPWQFGGREPDGNFRFVPRRHYYGGPLQLNEVVLTPVPTEGRALDLYRKNQVDVAPVPNDLFASSANRPDFRFTDSLDAYYALPRLRAGRALATSLDRDRLAAALPPSLDVLATLVPPSVPDYVSSTPTFTPTTQARTPGAHLLEVGRPNTTETSLIRALERQWHHTPDALPVSIVHRSFLLPDPGNWLGRVVAHIHSRWARNRLSKAGELTQDPVARMSSYADVEAWLLHSGTVIPLASGKLGIYMKSRVSSLQITPLGIMPENNSWSLVSTS